MSAGGRGRERGRGMGRGRGRGMGRGRGRGARASGRGRSPLLSGTDERRPRHGERSPSREPSDAVDRNRFRDRDDDRRAGGRGRDTYRNRDRDRRSRSRSRDRDRRSRDRSRSRGYDRDRDRNGERDRRSRSPDRNDQTSDSPVAAVPQQRKKVIRRESFYEVVESILAQARAFRRSSNTPCNFIFVDLASVATLGITSRQLYDVLFSDDLHPSTFVLMFTDSDRRIEERELEQIKESEGEHHLPRRRRKPRTPSYLCRGCGNEFCPSINPDQNSSSGLHQRFEISIDQLDFKSNEPKAMLRKEDAEQLFEAKKTPKQANKVSMKHLLSSALVYFLSRLSTYKGISEEERRNADKLWVITEHARLRDLSEQVEEFEAIQRELASFCNDYAYPTLDHYYLGLAEVNQPSDDKALHWQALGEANFVASSTLPTEPSTAEAKVESDKTNDNGTTGHLQESQSTGCEAILIKRISRWIVKNARNDFLRQIRDVVMLPRDRSRLRNFIAPLCKFTRAVRMDEVIQLLHDDGILSVCDYCHQFRWDERALYSEELRLERKRRLERERARGVMQGRERMIERIISTIQAKGSHQQRRPKNRTEMQKVVDNLGSYEEIYDGDRIIQRMIDEGILAVEDIINENGRSLSQTREVLRYAIAEPVIIQMKLSELKERGIRDERYEAELVEARKRKAAIMRARHEAAELRIRQQREEDEKRRREEYKRLRQEEEQTAGGDSSGDLSDIHRTTSGPSKASEREPGHLRKDLGYVTGATGTTANNVGYPAQVEYEDDQDDLDNLFWEEEGKNEEAKSSRQPYSDHGPAPSLFKPWRADSSSTAQSYGIDYSSASSVPYYNPYSLPSQYSNYDSFTTETQAPDAAYGLEGLFDDDGEDERGVHTKTNPPDPYSSAYDPYASYTTDSACWEEHDESLGDLFSNDWTSSADSGGPSALQGNPHHDWAASTEAEEEEGVTDAFNLLFNAEDEDEERQESDWQSNHTDYSVPSSQLPGIYGIPGHAVLFTSWEM